ncbi:nickel pincer cofactor biosynthesis protein LarC [Streptosporangium sp. NPDC087985]|uniref:nickel pincer cofactor biosynthesis protein LarC n=1 Tax=Streptosporangium sp. NPDC087985 TaxID=3366196 RepID=UPI00380BB8AB
MASTGPTARHAWIDATAGVAGDMLLGALVDAGARLEAIQSAADAVMPDTVRFSATTVRRAGMRATKVDVRALTEDHPHRAWRDIRRMLDAADLPAGVGDRARQVFLRLAEAEGRVHGVLAEDVHFHEVGAWDSIADVVGVCAALDALGVASVTTSAIALGTGRTRAAHGEIPVPVPAVLELARGWRVMGGGDGELATPTGVALLTTLSQESGDLPAMAVTSVGVGAGTKDFPGRPNVVRVMLGIRADGAGSRPDPAGMTVLETNVDDMDPRLWPTVLTALLEAGAADAWLVPILMKKGRPAHTLKVLTSGERRDGLRRLVFDLTSTIGIREVGVGRTALDRTWVQVPVAGSQVRIKVAHAGGRIVRATPEFDDVAALAADRSLPVRQVLEEAVAQAVAVGLVPGAVAPQV